MHDFANGAFPRAGTAFSDMHIALAQAVAGNETALEAREGQIHELARNSRYPSGPLVPAVSRSFAAFEPEASPEATRGLSNGAPAPAAGLETQLV